MITRNFHIGPQVQDFVIWLQEFCLLQRYSCTIEHLSHHKVTFTIQHKIKIAILSLVEGNNNDLDCNLVIWEDQWIKRPKVVKSKVAALLGLSIQIQARQTIVTRIDKQEYGDFLDAHHIHGMSNAKFKYGLLYKNVLIAVVGFTSARKFYYPTHIASNYGLVRFCAISGVQIVGGLSKLIFHFAKAHQAHEIMTIIDLDWGDGHGYGQIGFKETDITKDTDIYIDAQDLSRSYFKPKSERYTSIKSKGSIQMKLFIDKTVV